MKLKYIQSQSIAALSQSTKLYVKISGKSILAFAHPVHNGLQHCFISVVEHASIETLLQCIKHSMS